MSCLLPTGQGRSCLTLGIYVLLLLLLLLPSVSLSLPASELQALYSLYNSTEGYQWVWTGVPWNFSNLTSANPCTQNWQGVSCVNGHIAALSLANNRMNGSLPVSSWNNLPFLSSLQLKNNMLLSGRIPDSICQLRQLSSLVLANNSLSGSMPTCVGQLSRLKQLNLGFNYYLNGVIPQSFCNLMALKSFSAVSNMLTGSLPACNFNASYSLSAVVLSYNFLRGSIPKTWCSLPLDKVLLTNNLFSGSIPSCIVINSIFIAANNKLTGTLPPGLFTLNTSLVYLATNMLTGTIPSSFSSANRLETILVDDNFLDGTIPKDICKILGLEWFTASDNLLTGHIPICGNEHSHDNFTFPTKLINLGFNEFSGKIPDWVCQDTRSLYLSYNFFDNNLTACTDDASVLRYFFVNENLLTGSIPPSISNIDMLQGLYLYSNYLTGSITSKIFSISGLLQFFANDNLFSGSVPQISDTSSLTRVNISSNFLVGTLPASLLTASFLQILDVSYNHLSGSIYTNDVSASQMTEFLLQGNRLAGKFSSLISLFTDSIQIIDASNNLFTGTIPSKVFLFPELQVLVASSNCITGSIPEIICNGSARSMKLQTLALDGLGSATECRTPVFLSQLQKSASYLAQSSLMGSIPSCLFIDYPALQTLHISGNRLQGNIPELPFISSNLTELSLSYNYLTGNIPSIVQSHPWRKLDLSSNRLRGGLFIDFGTYNEADSSLQLNENRLSGSIPESLKSATEINILDGNLFECDVEETTLPTNDPTADSYQCGSKNTDIGIYFWLGLMFFAFISIVGYSIVLRNNWRTERDQVDSGNAITTFILICHLIQDSLAIYFDRTMSSDHTVNIYHIYNYGILQRELRKWCLRVTIPIILVGLLIFPSLSSTFGTYDDSFAWILSLGFMSGLTPALVGLFLLIIFLVTLFMDGFEQVKINLNSFLNAYINRQLTANRDTLFSTNMSIVKMRSYWHLYAQWFGLLLLNIIVVLTINMSYVYAEDQDNINSADKMSITFTVSLFKVAWSVISLRLFERVLYQAPEVTEQDYMDFSVFMTWLSIFNNVIVLLISTAVYSTKCFYYVFYTPDAVTSTFDLKVCIADHTEILYTGPGTLGYNNMNCDAIQPVSSSFSPPFSYSYQCSSALLLNFVPVLIFRSILSGFVVPLLQSSMPFILKRVANAVGKHSYAYKLLFGITRTHLKLLILKEEDYNELSDISKARMQKSKVFDIHEDFIATVTDIAILITFGSIFSPIAAVVCCAIFSRTLINQYAIGRLVLLSTEQAFLKPFVAKINEECKRCFALWQFSFFSLCYLVSMVWSWFLFDTLGDAFGARYAYWVLYVCVSIPTSILLYNYVRYQRYFANQGSEPPSLSRPSDDAIEMGNYSFAESFSGRGPSIIVAKGTVPTVQNPMFAAKQEEIEAAFNGKIAPEEIIEQPNIDK